ncbi:MAG: hypothetical protein NVS4B9_06410 [Ktedonobacteraceae bacterium]
MAKAKPIANIDAHAPTGKNARIIARTRLEEMYTWDIYVDDPDNVHELHDMRIAAKRLRYTLEIFEATFPQERESIIQEVTKIQEELGAIHDSDVMIALLRLCLHGHTNDADDANDEPASKDLAEEQRDKRDKAMVNPALLAFLLDPRAAPVAEERMGLELLLRNLQQEREDQYTAFRQHWHWLKQQDFQHRITALLES